MPARSLPAAAYLLRPPFFEILKKQEARKALAKSSAAVLTLEPGSGKTTIAPPFAMLDQPWLAGRYPEQYWPENLLKAQATVRAKRRKR